MAKETEKNLHDGALSKVEVANLFGESDEMADDLLDTSINRMQGEAYRSKRQGTSATRLSFGGKPKK